MKADCREGGVGKGPDAPTGVFDASWDRGMWILNCVLVVLMTGLTATLIAAAFKAMRQSTALAIIGWAGAAVPGLIVLIASAFAPRRYEIRGADILVKRFLAKDVRIPLDKVYSVEAADYEYVFKKAFRVMGSGGMFGIYGHFASANLERFKAYMTRRSRLVMIKTVDMPFVVTPDHPEDFIAAVRREKTNAASKALG
jgi:hypothetical protein